MNPHRTATRFPSPDIDVQTWVDSHDAALESPRRRLLLRRCLSVVPVAIVGTTAGCTVTTEGVDAGPDPAHRRMLDTAADEAMSRLFEQIAGARELVAKARGVLVFPSVVAAGFWVGGDYGEGVLRVKGAVDGYYRIASATLGLQLGAQSKALFFLFMTEPAFAGFRRGSGWAVGGDASVALLNAGINGGLDTRTATPSVFVYMLTNVGLMANLTLSGTRITRLAI